MSMGTQFWCHRKALIWTNLMLCEYEVLSFYTITKCSFEHFVSMFLILNAWIEYFVSTLWAFNEYLKWTEYFVSTWWVPHTQNWVLYEHSMSIRRVPLSFVCTCHNKYDITSMTLQVRCKYLIYKFMEHWPVASCHTAMFVCEINLILWRYKIIWCHTALTYS